MRNLNKYTDQLEKACRYARKEMKVTGSNHSIPRNEKSESVILKASEIYNVRFDNLKNILQDERRK
jgi:hypothetical protein